MIKTFLSVFLKTVCPHLIQGKRPSQSSLLLLTSAFVFAFGCHKPDVDPPQSKRFEQINLVANSAAYQPLTIDPKLINGFGLAWSPSGIAWVNSVGGHVSALYTADGAIARSAVNIPSRTDTINGFPCGIVFSGGQGFNLTNGPSLFLFTSFDGVLSGWNPASGNNATRLRAPEQASYTGLAIGSDGVKNLIFGANFGASKIDVWDTAFSRVAMNFTDPTLPIGYSPYNIQSIDNLIYVVYGKLGADGHPVAGTGNGYVSVFNTKGEFLKRFASEGALNIPWGITAASASFLRKRDIKPANSQSGHAEDNADYGQDEEIKESLILIGNFGDGRINVFSQSGTFLGQLRSAGNVVEIDGLWALSFGPQGVAGIDPNRLYFTAGPKAETDGLFGYLVKK
jgi:uncharacterized protein (TIGR03118 family)